MKPIVFISYSSKDKHFARVLGSKLSDAGAKVWVDELELLIGDSLQEVISRAIDDSDYFVAVLSHNSVGSRWVREELKQAIAQEMENGRKKVLPVLLSDCEIPPFLKDKLYADFRDPDQFETAWTLLVKSMGLKEETPPVKAPSTGSGRIAHTVNLVHAEKELEDFTDISIIEIDKARCYQPDKSNRLWNIYLKLSTPPSQIWVEIFEAERRFPRHLMWRRAWIEDDYIVVYCVPSEIKTHHRGDLVQDVAMANEKYRKYMLEQRERRDALQKEEYEKQRTLDDDIEGVKF